MKMKRTVLRFFMATIVCCGAFGLAGCADSFLDETSSEPTNEIVGHVHDWNGAVTKEATCEEGVLTYSCYCGESYTIALEAKGHLIETHAGREATCLQIGWNEYETCLREGCSYTTYEEIEKKAHTFVEGVCTADNCGAVEHVHVWDEWMITTMPTCTEKGVITYTCACSQQTTESIDALGHDVKENEIVCPQSSVCDRCEELVIDVNTHTWIEVPGLEPEGVMCGYTQYQCCEVCGIEIGKEILCDIHVFDNSLDSYAAGVAATCVAVGKTESGDCFHCRKYIPAEEIPMTEHGYISGMTYRTVCGTYDTCNDCGAACSEPVAHNLKYIETVEPTCKAAGCVGGTICLNEGCPDYPFEAEMLSALGHAPEGEWISVEAKPATCAEAGHGAYTYCPNCGEKKNYMVIEAVSHVWDTVTTEDYKYHPTAMPATCTTAGWEVNMKCKNCTFAIVGAEIPAKGHTWTTPTCQAASTCSVCGLYNPAEEDMRLICGENKVEIPQVNPTCTQSGMKSYYVCANEGCMSSTMYVIDSIDVATGNVTYRMVRPNELIIPATGHYFEEVEGKDPTCTEPGYEEYEECKFCGAIQNGCEVPPLGHSYEGEETCMEYVNCSECGEKIPTPSNKQTDCHHDTNNDNACDICGKEIYD